MCAYLFKPIYLKGLRHPDSVHSFKFSLVQYVCGSSHGPNIYVSVDRFGIGLNHPSSHLNQYTARFCNVEQDINVEMEKSNNVALKFFFMVVIIK